MFRFSDMSPIEMITRLLALMVCFTVHEYCHGLSAYLLGDSTAKRDGRLSLNPVKHVDPIGLVMLMLVGFGWAKPVMVDPRRLKNPKGDMAIISFCGPASNFLLGFVFIMIYPLSNYVPGIVGDFLTAFLVQGFQMNIALGIFNMLPIPPLDGLKVFSAILPDDLYAKVMNFNSRAGTYLFLILALTGILGRILSPLISAVANAYMFAVSNIYGLFL
ncbi:MAG: site-2 protease family protein [Clostridiales bacterium]|jgi:Zn-dependent protease|nr:site-2 protease family protein [Clostridiales bacterium]